MSNTRRELAHNTVAAMLDARHVDDARQALGDISRSYYATYFRGNLRPTRAFMVDVAFGQARAERQIINAATGELLCDKVIDLMSIHHSRTGSFVPRNDTRLRLEQDKYAQYSPALRLFLSSLDFWFSKGLDQVFDDDRAGRMPAAAIGEVARESYSERTDRLKLWLKYSSSLEARQWFGEFEPTHEAEAIKTYSDNTIIAAAMLLGRGVAHDLEAPTMGRTAFASQQLGRMAAFSTVKKAISKPVMDEAFADNSLLAQYSAWENGTLDAAAFLRNQGMFTCPDAIYDPSLEGGAWEKAGYCGGNLPFVYAERFSRSPEAFLGRLGIAAPSPQENTVAGIFVGSGVLIANETIYANWPS